VMINPQPLRRALSVNITRPGGGVMITRNHCRRALGGAACSGRVAHAVSRPTRRPLPPLGVGCVRLLQPSADRAR